jgi:hypothetical protein
MRARAAARAARALHHPHDFSRLDDVVATEHAAA